MSTSAVSSSSLNQQLQQYYQTRQSDLYQLGQALQSGNLTEAQTEFNNITALGQNGPFANGQPFAINQREQDFTAVGQALQNGDLAGAQQAFSQLQSTFKHLLPQSGSGSGSGTASSTPVSPEIVLNINGAGNTATPEQITINLSNSGSGGGEQVSLSVGNQGSNPQQITFNLGANSDEQIVLNLLGASPAGESASSSTTGSGISISA
jgi:hypothetical protein